MNFSNLLKLSQKEPFHSDDRRVLACQHVSIWAPCIFASYIRPKLAAVVLKLALSLALQSPLTSWSISNGRSSNNVCDQYERMLCAADCVGGCLVGGLRRKHRTDDHGHCGHVAHDHQKSSCSCNSQCGHCDACHKDCCNAVWHHQLGRQIGPCHRYATHPFTVVSFAFCTHLHWGCANTAKQMLDSPS